MLDMQQDIRDWLKKAAEKLLLSGNLADGNSWTIVELFKAPAKQQKTAHQTSDDLTESSVSAVEINNVSGIENTGSHSLFAFSGGNLKAIYGKMVQGS